MEYRFSCALVRGLPYFAAGGRQKLIVVKSWLSMHEE